MNLVRTKDYEALSRRAAAMVAAQILLKPDCVLGLATGSSPVGLYKQLVAQYQKGELDFSKVTSINLDEYKGLAPDHEQSYRRFMNDNLFCHVNIDPSRTFVPDGMETDSEKACRDYDQRIAAEGGIDLQLLGLGNNGHIGFNEPAEAFATGTHCVRLTQSTIDANKRFFASEEDVPRYAYTMGIRSIMQARRILLIVSGEAKAQALRDALFGPVTPKMPASILQLHADVTVVADEGALKLADKG
ncbi:MAG: glucosamine-6-phosphate deaminase [Eubacterium sp.]|nr:glucosamine-6-phosphate deaminase [Eubacterium sp.]